MKTLASLNILLLIIFTLSCDESIDGSENSDGEGPSISVSVMGGGSSSAKTFQAKALTTTTTSASSLKLRVYKIGFSTSGDCSSPKVVDLSGIYLDFINTPDLGEGDIPAADYQCIIIEMSDQIKFTPTADVGSNCDSTTEYTQDICTFDSSQSSDLPDYNLLDEVGSSSCSSTAGNDDRIVMHLSVNAKTSAFIAAQSNAVQAFIYPPLSTDPINVTLGNTAVDIYGGFHLSSSFNAAEDSVGIFYMDASNKVSSNASTCFIDVPTFGFYKQ